MKYLLSWIRPLLPWCIALAFSTGPCLQAYPPAPHHSFYGNVKDEFGNPLNQSGAVVILETDAGLRIKTFVLPGLESGANYRLPVPMDAGMTEDLYKPTALRPAVPFKMKVQLGNTVYLPIEMIGDYSKMGQPGKSTRLDLTLGEDADGDGIPDAWERKLLKPGQTLSDIKPDADADADGLSNLQEYITGTYAYDPADGFALKLVSSAEGEPLLEFTAVPGRTYSLVASSELDDWQPIPFAPVDHGSPSEPRSSYYSSDVRTLRVRPLLPAGNRNVTFFRLVVH